MRIILIGYLLIMFGVGIWANKFNNDMTDFLLAGRRLGIGLATFTLAATYFGGGYVVGLSETAYDSGLVSWWNGIGGGIGLIAVGFMAFKMRDLSLFTVPDYLMKRFNNNFLRISSAILSLIALIGILAAQVGAASRIFELLGFGSTMTSAVLASLIFVIYTAIGGLWAATLTDFIQVSIAGIGVVAAFFIALGNIGGWGFITEQLSSLNVGENFLSFTGGGNITFILWLTLPMVLYTLIGQDVYQRIFSTKDAKTAKKACFFSGIIIIILTLFPVLLGITGKVMYPELENAGLALPKIIMETFPTFLGGLVLSAIIAAIMSTADSILTASTSHVINDIYIKTLNKEASVSDKKMLNWSRACTVIVGLFAVIVSALVPKIVTLLLYSYTLYTGGVFIPVVGGFFWKKATTKGALAAMITGTFIAVLGIIGVNMFGIPTEILAGLVSLIVLIVVSLSTQKEEYSK